MIHALNTALYKNNALSMVNELMREKGIEISTSSAKILFLKVEIQKYKLISLFLLICKLKK